MIWLLSLEYSTNAPPTHNTEVNLKDCCLNRFRSLKYSSARLWVGLRIKAWGFGLRRSIEFRIPIIVDKPLPRPEAEIISKWVSDRMWSRVNWGTGFSGMLLFCRVWRI